MGTGKLIGREQKSYKRLFPVVGRDKHKLRGSRKGGMCA